MRHIFYDSLKRFFVACALTIVGIFSATAATLPSGYTELEYIQSTGTQYIDTGAYITSNNLLVKTKAYSTTAGTSTEQDLFGNQDGTVGRMILGLSASNNLFLYTRYGTAAASPMVTAPFAQNQIFNIETHIENGQKWLVVDGVASETGTATNISNTNKTVQLFANGNTTYFFKGRMYYFQMWDNGTLVRDFVPAKNSSGVVGMYDTVNDQFYTNAGTGTFTAGPEVVQLCNLYNAQNSTSAWINEIGEASPTSNYIATDYIEIEPSTDYSVYANLIRSPGSSHGIRIAFYDSSKKFISPRYGGTAATMGEYIYTMTSPSNAKYIRISSGGTNTVDKLILVKGTYNTTDVPKNINNCPAGPRIKIATTKYTEDAFAGLMTTLSEAITKVTNIVDTTVQQATEIGNLATTKQDRPDTDCPAGRKCLLIMGADNKPHWYLIQE